jgi:PIN domain nuclease of toxin-antitoxin system
LLLDTHTLLWHADGDAKMSSTATALLADPANELHLSMASVWELAIKVGIGKLPLTAPFDVYLSTAIDGYGLIVLPITFGDCVSYHMLPFPDPQHRDPFDRMIVTHAQRHGLSVVGADVAFDPYGVVRLW